MKKTKLFRRIAVFALALTLCLGCLAGAADAIHVVAVAGFPEIKRIAFFNAKGEEEWYDVFDENGNRLWVEDYFGPGAWDWVPIGEAKTEAELQQLAAGKKSALEQQYGIWINDSLCDSTAARVRKLDSLAASLKAIPAALYESARAQLTAQGRKLTVVLAMDNEGKYGVAGTYGNDVITMYTVDKLYFAHEYGHMLNTLLDARLGWGAVTARIRELNGAPYSNEQGYDESTWENYITPYASTSAGEDFAELVSTLLTWPDQIWSASAIGRTVIRSKAEAVRGMLIECFSLAESDLPGLDAPQPSAWAAEGVAQYTQRFPSQNVFSGFAGYNIYPRYQSPATRRDFAIGACQMIYQDWQQRYSGSWQEIMAQGIAEHAPQYAGVDLRFLNPFADSEDDAAAALYALGIVNGKSDRVFDPWGSITREEAAAMLYRLCKVMGYDFSGVTPVTPADAADCADWALESISMLCGAGIMNGVGDGVFSPKSLYTEEQSALTLNRCYDLLHQNG